MTFNDSAVFIFLSARTPMGICIKVAGQGISVCYMVCQIASANVCSPASTEHIDTTVRIKASLVCTSVLLQSTSVVVLD